MNPVKTLWRALTRSVTFEPPEPHDPKFEELVDRLVRPHPHYDFEPAAQEIRARAKAVEDDYTVLRRSVKPGNP